MRTYKHYLIVAAIIAAVGAGGYAVGRFTTPPHVLTITKPGAIEYRDRLIWQPTTNAGACCMEYNAVLAYLDTYLSSPPIVDEITRDMIRFHIMSNRYSLTYHVNDVPAWHIAPIIAGRARWTSTGPDAALGGGIMADYASIGGGVIINGLLPTRDIDAVLFAYVRF